MSKNLLFPKAEEVLIACGFTIIEKERSYILGKDKAGNYARFIYCEGVTRETHIKKGKRNER